MKMGFLCVYYKNISGKKTFALRALHITGMGGEGWRGGRTHESTNTVCVSVVFGLKIIKVKSAVIVTVHL